MRWIRSRNCGLTSALPVENVTTNAVLLDEEVADILVTGRCDEVTVSINQVADNTRGAWLSVLGSASISAD